MTQDKLTKQYKTIYLLQLLKVWTNLYTSPYLQNITKLSGLKTMKFWTHAMKAQYDKLTPYIKLARPLKFKDVLLSNLEHLFHSFLRFRDSSKFSASRSIFSACAVPLLFGMTAFLRLFINGIKWKVGGGKAGKPRP